MSKAITKTVSVAGLTLASTMLTLIALSSAAGAVQRPGGPDPAVTVLAGGAEWG
ncbi:hypothetical protein ACFQFC_12150 [Amorphoplanes digitatis]|uniref:Uncharacterized protein n=1 Tax=Actinoplanes digitatis TaxID=1868 RepID=A0A7W7I1W6_9ACTN|nr:hypothetical protein [Actinoplanes digitatis]MBB4764953.1 hypothetical protein [Actinoplanes digitatis]BFE74605.1 hypothetical protein GCM10020092_079060 [Actinoplanes digitatis]GID93956.1 hypothetical protein Adi01nite_33680 [Actinoplanes digitatis]